MKKLFMEPALTVDKFASEDVIAASYEVGGIWHDISTNEDGSKSGDNGGKDIF